MDGNKRHAHDLIEPGDYLKLPQGSKWPYFRIVSAILLRDGRVQLQGQESTYPPGKTCGGFHWRVYQWEDLQQMEIIHKHGFLKWLIKWLLILITIPILLIYGIVKLTQ